jgi:DNA-directed RNA polymerase specialized sigma24 family protein
VDTLPETQRRIVWAMLREPASYDALSRELGIPRGSLGPLRGRAVRALRAQLEPSLR